MVTAYPVGTVALMSDEPRRFYLREWRETRGLTQQQLADRIEVSAVQISRLETGARRYNEDVLAALAFALSIEPWQLLGDDPTKQDAEIVDLWSRIRPDSKDAALRMLRGLADDGNEKAG